MGVLFGDFSPRISWTFSIPSACYFPRGTAGQGRSRPASSHRQLYFHAFQSVFFFSISGRVEKQGSHKRHTVLPLTWERQHRPFVTSQRAESQNCFLRTLSKKKEEANVESLRCSLTDESHYYNICITFSVYLYQLPLMKIDDEDAMLIFSLVKTRSCFFSFFFN